MKFAQYLELKFIEWQRQQGGRKTVLDFSNYLGIAQTTASQYMNGNRIPQGESVNKLARILGIEIYDSLDLPRPDEDLFYIEKEWDQLDDKTRQQLRDLAEDGKRRNDTNEVLRSSKKRKSQTAD